MNQAKKTFQVNFEHSEGHHWVSFKFSPEEAFTFRRTLQECCALPANGNDLLILDSEKLTERINQFCGSDVLLFANNYTAVHIRATN